MNGLFLKTIKLVNLKKVIALIVVAILLFYFLDLIFKYNVILYHTIAEMITIFASMLIIVITISVWKFIRINTFVSVVAISTFLVALVDILHLFAYPGLEFFPNYLPGTLITSLWIFARYVQAIALLVAILLHRFKVINYYVVVFVMSTITLLGVLSIFYEVFPASYIYGVGLSSFKIVSEYIIMLIFIISAYLIIRLKISPSSQDLSLYVLFVIFQVITEFFFTQYSFAGDYGLFLGHYFKIFASITFAIILLRLTIIAPNMALFNKIVTNEKKLIDLAFTDVLTQQGNRRKFDRDVANLDYKENLPITYIMLDINGLKTFNDSFGHLLGDQLIIEVADSISLSIRDVDLCYRLGGDEFMVVLLNSSDDISKKVLSRIIINLSEKQVKKIKISIAYGIATKLDDSVSMSELYILSENAMYRNKANKENSRHGENLRVILNSLFEKNEETEKHSRRVSEIATNFGNVLDLDPATQNDLEIISLLHDIGKIGISEEILNKDGKLTNEEYAIIKTHPIIGNRIISTIKSFEGIGIIVLSHHENWDGTGYPDGKEKMEIPYLSRILALCDTFDAMTSDRRYKDKRTVVDACEEIIRCSESQFDPNLAKVFVDNINSILR